MIDFKTTIFDPILHPHCSFDGDELAHFVFIISNFHGAPISTVIDEFVHYLSDCL
jgi:hypothetical protein